MLRKIGEFMFEADTCRLKGQVQMREDGRTYRVIICQNREKKTEHDPDYVAFRIIKGKKKKEVSK